jgi:uncharacterized protein YoxC
MINDFEFRFPLPYPLLRSAPSQFDAFAQSAATVITNLTQIDWENISDELEGTLQGTNKLVNDKNLELMIADLRETTKALSELIQNLNQNVIANNIENTTFAVSNAASQLEKFSTNLNTQLEELNIPNYLDRYYVDFNQTLQSVNQLVEGTTIQFRSSMLGVNILLEDMDRTNRVLQRTLRNVNESPYMFLTAPPPKEDIREAKRKK